MNVAEKLAALEALLARVRRNAAARRGVDGAPPIVAEDPPVDRPVARRPPSSAPPPSPRLERLLAKTFDTWGDGPETRPETLTQLLGQPVPRSARAAEPAPQVAPVPALPPPPLLPREAPPAAAASVRPLVPDGAVLVAVTERPAPPPPSLARAVASRRRPRLRRWFLPRSAGRRSTGASLGRVALVALIALPLVGGAVWALRRPTQVEPPRGAPESVVALGPAPQTAPEVAAPAAAAPEPAPTPSVEGSTLPPDRGYVIVATSGGARVYFNGVLAGDSNRPLEVACGWRNMRLAKAAMPGPGESFPIWQGDGRPVLIACQSTTTLDMVGR